MMDDYNMQDEDKKKDYLDSMLDDYNKQKDAPKATETGAAQVEGEAAAAQVE